MSKYTRWMMKRGGGAWRLLTKWNGAGRWKVAKKPRRRTQEHILKDESYIFQIQFLKTHFDCVWILLPRFQKIKIVLNWSWWVEKANCTQWQGWCLCDSRKRTKVPCFPHSPTFHEDYDMDSKWKDAIGWWMNSSYDKKLNNKQLWCAPLQRCSLGGGEQKTWRLTKPNYETHCYSEDVEANNVNTGWSLQGDITQLRVCGITSGWWRGRGGGGGVKSVTIDRS